MPLDGVPDDYDWLFDTDRPLVIDDDTWREKQEAVERLDKWYWEPTDRVRDIFLSWRGEGPDCGELTPEDWDEVQDHLERDVVAWVWFACYYKDRNSRRKMRATPTSAQLVVLWRFAKLIDEHVPVRLALLKARQFGFSWLFCQLVLWIVANNQHLTALHVAHDKKSTQSIFRYLKEGHQWLPQQLRPLTAAASKNELYLANPDQAEWDNGNEGQDSRAVVDTAGNEFAGTADAVQIAHVSEIGKWDKKSDPEVIWTSFANAMQDEPNTFIFAESTAHGSGTYWHQMWGGSMKIGGPGWNGFTPIFIPWYFDRRNSRPAPPDMVLLNREDSEYGNEVAIAKRYNLSIDQMAWRRRAIDKQPEGRRKVDLFNQEHPSSPEIAWLFAGGKWLETELVAAATERCNNEMKTGRLTRLFVGDLDPCIEKDIDFAQPLIDGNRNEWLRRRALGAFTVYRWPHWRHEYVIGVDVSEGNDGSDASCAKVYQRVGFTSDGDALCRIAAEWYGLVPEDILSDIIWRLGWFYGTGTGPNRVPALLAWERTGPGRGLGLWLRSKAGRVATPYPPSRMYRQQQPDSQHYAQDSHYGISTNKSTKPVMMGILKGAIRDGNIQLTPEDIREVQTVSTDDRNLIVTKGRDRTMAAAMAQYACTFTTHIWGKDEKKEDETPEHSVKWSIEQAVKAKSAADKDVDEDVSLT